MDATIPDLINVGCGIKNNTKRVTLKSFTDYSCLQFLILTIKVYADLTNIYCKPDNIDLIITLHKGNSLAIVWSHTITIFEKPPLMEKRTVDVVVLSDIHLGTYGCCAKELLAYLKSISPGVLILNGDIIDGWQFSRHYFPSAHIAVIKEVLNLLTKGTRMFYITGNHDELMRKYTDFQLSNFSLTDKLVLEIDNKMTWIFHGDVYDHTTKGSAKILARLGSSGYALLILFNRLINGVLKMIGRERVSFSKQIMAGVNKAMSKINDFETIAAEIAIEKKYDYVICGHIHQPQKRVVENQYGKVTYLNSGDWVEHMTALEYCQKEWKIFQYEEVKFEHPPQAEQSRNVTVITDTISMEILHLYTDPNHVDMAG